MPSTGIRSLTEELRSCKPAVWPKKFLKVSGILPLTNKWSTYEKKVTRGLPWRLSSKEFAGFDP